MDHFAWSAASPQQRGVHTCFPVWNSSRMRTHEKWQKQVAEQMSGAPAGLVEAILKLEAWQDGRDSLLWAIHELDRVDKHRILLSVAVALAGVDLDGDSYELAITKKYSGFDPGNPLPLEPIRWTPIEEGVKLLESPGGADFGSIRSTLRFGVMLGEPEMLRGRSAVTQLRILAGLAEKVIRDLVALS
jgi:hypothetical protein